MTRPACLKTTNRAFDNPTTSPGFSIRAAVKLCQCCPIIRECATRALTAGTSLSEDFRAPANDVIQAGIICRGDQDTAFRLAAVAGVPVPSFLIEERRRARPGDRCRSCGEPMVKWNRNEQQPEGYVKHHARGFCTNCRKAYKAWKDENNVPSVQRGLRKPIDRHRHVAPSRKKGAPVVQLPLFEVA